MGQAYTRNELGACHSRTSACQGCTHQEDTQSALELVNSVQATRNAGCYVLDDEAFCDPITPMERIYYWACVGAAIGVSIVLVFGTLGYLSAKACGM